VEKSELVVLNGIKDDDWKRIKQIVLEVDVKENLKTILPLLERRGYELVVEQDELLENTELCYVYAIRPSADRKLIKDKGQIDSPRLPMLNDYLLAIDDLRRFLSDKLPEFMVPSAFVILESLPRTLNGKIDRRILPPLGEAGSALDASYDAPETPVERLIAEIWRELLHVDHVGVRDNFFDLGGHSLLSLQVVTRLEKELRVRINPRELVFQTLGQLAAVCDSRLKNGGKPQSGRLTRRVMKSIQRVFYSE